MPTLLITAELPENAARQLADKLMDGEHHLPISAAGAFEAAPPLWRFEAWSAQSIDQASFANTACRMIGAKRLPRFRYQTINDKDWVAKSLEDLPPVRAGRFVIFGAHDRDKGKANEIRLEIEASLAFGTGHHATTLGCLLELDRWTKLQRNNGLKNLSNKRPAILDLGTGTGVLALAAAKALPVSAIASDIDADAVHTAKIHARRAGLQHKVHIIQARGTQHPLIRSQAPYALVMANILADPLVALARDIALVMRHDGTLILSGLLYWQARRIEATYRAQGFVLEHRRRIGDWMTLVMKYKPAVEVQPITA